MYFNNLLIHVFAHFPFNYQCSHLGAIQQMKQLRKTVSL